LALHDRDPLDRWSTRRVTIIGDAAHPMLPFLAQGANQAIEDAMVLAVFLREATRRDEVATALARYEDVRRGRTQQLQGIARRNTSLLHLPDGDDQRERDATLAATADLSSQEWLFGYDAETEASAA
jgi:salicylate hydroxylase